MARVNVMKRVENGAPLLSCASRDDAAGHPVVAMHDQVTAVFCPDSRHDLIDNGLLQLGGIAGRITGIGAGEFFENS